VSWQREKAKARRKHERHGLERKQRNGEDSSHIDNCILF
jgi:hypothetical protein